MKNNPTVATGVIFAVVVVATLLISANLSSSHSGSRDSAEAFLMVMPRLVGNSVAAVALIALLLRVMQGGTPREFLPLTLPILGGVLVAAPTWSTFAAFFVLVASGLVVGLVWQRAWLPNSTDPPV